MIRICSGCGKHLGEKEPIKDKRVTHTICPECVQKYYPEYCEKTVDNTSKP